MSPAVTEEEKQTNRTTANARITQQSLCKSMERFTSVTENQEPLWVFPSLHNRERHRKTKKDRRFLFRALWDLYELKTKKINCINMRWKISKQWIYFVGKWCCRGDIYQTHCDTPKRRRFPLWPVRGFPPLSGNIGEKRQIWFPLITFFTLNVLYLPFSVNC